MRRSFYHYLMTMRGPDRDDVERFSNHVFLDSDFPKQTSYYETLSHYLETSVDYLTNMDIFDRVYADYLENNR